MLTYIIYGQPFLLYFHHKPNPTYPLHNLNKDRTSLYIKLSIYKFTNV